MISEEETIFKALCKTVELLEGSTALISQYYYGCLFNDLLAFQLADRHPPAEVISVIHCHFCCQYIVPAMLLNFWLL